MKRFAIAFVGLFLCAHTLLALHSSVTFTSRRGEIFQVYLNGRLVNRTGTNHVRLDRLPPGVHSIELHLPGPFDVLRYRAQIVLHSGYETNYVVRVANRRGLVRLRKVGMFPLPVPIVPVPPPVVYDPPRYRQPVAPTDACQYLLEDRSLERLLVDMSRSQTDAQRLNRARLSIRGGNILTQDLRRMLEVLEYEQSRIELAKLAFGQVCDKQNFYTLFNLFEFDESVRELEQFMQRR
jgi:hypothetical protein